MLRLFCFVSLVVFSLGAAMAADVLPAANKIDWTFTGVPGGIPNRTAIYTTLNPGASASQIQTAIDNCPNGQVVFLSAGTYTLSSGLRIARDNMTLRGAVDAKNQPATILNFTSSAGGWGLIDISKTSYPTSPSSIRDITSGYSRGSTTITLSSTPTGLAVGQILAQDQIADNNWVWDHGTESGSTWGRNGNRTLTQFVRVTAISGSTVSFEPGIYSSYWNASMSPQAYWWGSGTSQTVKLSGIENLKINRTPGGGGDHNVALGPADSCWVKNVSSTQCKSAHVKLGWTINCEVRDSYFTIHDDVGSATYSVWVIYSSAARVENNIMYNVPCALGMMSTTGSAVAYNYGTVFPYSSSSWLPETTMTHGGHTDHNLFEGNFVPSFWADRIHGNGSYNSYARNRVTGWESGKTGSTRCVNIQNEHYNLAVLGNVLGTAGYHNVYSSTSSDTTIFNVGTGAEATLIRKGNWNTVNNAIPAGESLGSDTIAASYLYANKPAWFGNLPWPTVDPLNPQAAVVANLPAGYRYLNGTMPPQGITTLQPPTNLRIVTQ